MKILRHKMNAGKFKPGIPMSGDVIVSVERKRSYIVKEDGSHRRLTAGQHVECLLKLREMEDQWAQEEAWMLGKKCPPI